MEITLIDLKYAFLAGLIEGDGCINLAVYYPKGTKTRIIGLYVTVTNTSMVLLAFLKEHYGGNITERHYSGPKRRAYYDWRVYGDDAKLLLIRIFPYLVSKKEQARLGVELQNTHHAGTIHSAEEEQRRDEIIAEMHALNAYGIKRQLMELNK